MNDPSGNQEIERAKRGDPAAVGTLYRRYWKAARAAAFAVTGDWGLAEDAASEGFSRAVATLDSLQDPARFGAWLRTIVIRKARAIVRRNAGAITGDCKDSAERPDQLLERREAAALVQTAIGRLPERLREAIALIYFEGYDAEDAARFLSVPPGTLRRRLHEGRTRIRELIQKGSNMNEQEKLPAERLDEIVASGDVYQLIRESIGLRRFDLLPPKEGVAKLAQQVVSRLGPPDPNHPVRTVASAIRQALPDWLGEYFQFSRGLVRVGEDGSVQTMYELLQECPDSETFTAAASQFCLSEVLDLKPKGALDLRDLQEILERLASAVSPGMTAQFSPYAEPRYRAALQMHFSAASRRAAIGGVLHGEAAGAHLRLYLEAWTPPHLAPRMTRIGDVWL